MSAIYIHIPFCLKKCSYCSFGSCVAGEPLYTEYVAALKKEIVSLAPTPLPVDTIFIGGGTPTCLPVEQLTGVLALCYERFEISDEAEISVEANPGTVDNRYLDLLLRGGVNRLSFGVQSFNDEELKRLGRLHSALEAEKAFSSARKAGFTNINIDLMYGLPGQSPASWEKTLNKAFSLAPPHFSLYQLTVEEGTPYQELMDSGAIVLPREEDVLEMDNKTAQKCALEGYSQYEISNYSLPGYQCRHNINYWCNNEYYGVGSSAVSYSNGCREKRLGSPISYVEAFSHNRPVVVERETLGKEESFRETVIMGLRMVRGVSLAALSKRYGLDPAGYYGKTLQHMIKLGLIEQDERYLWITDKGRPLSNSIMAELV
jgi:oxygen-independent coproporphyrinogen-3 oxidase